VFLTDRALPTTVVSIERLIAAPPEVVFELYCDPERLREWQPALRGLIDRTGPLNAPGTSYVLDQPGPRLQITVLQADPPYLHEQRENFRWYGWVLAARFLPADTGTRTVFDYRYERGPRWLWAFVMRRLASTFGRAELKQLGHIAEQYARAS
jgi:uncharacterized protein YndB with AHSA1/START domain